VMEHVAGESIESYCDGRRLFIRERLELFVQVCAAVQYAHRNLIVHRDIKSSNIFVTAEGARSSWISASPSCSPRKAFRTPCP